MQWITCSPRVWYIEGTGHAKDYKIGNGCFSAKNAPLRSKIKAWNHDGVD